MLYKSYKVVTNVFLQISLTLQSLELMKLREMKRVSLIIIILLFCLNGQSQSILNPNYGLKTPLTAEIIRVDFNSDATVVWLTIMSDINNAWFCIDKNTFIIKPDGMKVRLKSLKGLPYCPATYRFKKPGEKLSFSMTFPATGLLPWFSLVEECSGGCLAIRGIVTGGVLNNRLNEAYALSDKGDEMAAYRLFEEIINETDSLNLGIEGSIYTNLILIDRKNGRPQTAKGWYDRMMTSDTPDLGLYLESLRREGIDY